MEDSKKKEVEKRGIFNEDGDIDLSKKKNYPMPHHKLKWF